MPTIDQASGFCLASIHCPTKRQHTRVDPIVDQCDILHCPLSAAYFVSFGPHGPRKPITASGQGAKTLAGVLALLGVSAGVYYLMRAKGKFALTWLPVTKRAKCSYRSAHIVSTPACSYRWCPPQDYDQGVAGGLQRACSRTEAEPYLRYLQRTLQGQGSRSVRIGLRISTLSRTQNSHPINPRTHISFVSHAPSFAGRKDNSRSKLQSIPSHLPSLTTAHRHTARSGPRVIQDGVGSFKV